MAGGLVPVQHRAMPDHHKNAAAALSLYRNPLLADLPLAAPQGKSANAEERDQGKHRVPSRRCNLTRVLSKGGAWFTSRLCISRKNPLVWPKLEISPMNSSSKTSLDQLHFRADRFFPALRALFVLALL